MKISFIGHKKESLFADQVVIYTSEDTIYYYLYFLFKSWIEIEPCGYFVPLWALTTLVHV